MRKSIIYCSFLITSFRYSDFLGLTVVMVSIDLHCCKNTLILVAVWVYYICNLHRFSHSSELPSFLFEASVLVNDSTQYKTTAKICNYGNRILIQLFAFYWTPFVLFQRYILSKVWGLSYYLLYCQGSIFFAFQINKLFSQRYRVFTTICLRFDIFIYSMILISLWDFVYFGTSAGILVYFY